MWRRITFLPKPRQITFLTILSILFVTMLLSIIITIVLFKDEGVVKIHAFLYNATTDTLNLDDTVDSSSYVLNGLTVHSATFVNSDAASVAKSKIALDKFLIEVDFYSVDVATTSSIKGRVHITVPPSYRTVTPSKNSSGAPYTRVPSSSIPNISLTAVIGSKLYTYTPGKLIEDFDMVVSLTGDLSDYPFDEYQSTAYFSLYRSVELANRTKLPLGIAITAAVQGFRIKSDGSSTAFIDIDGSDEVGFVCSIRRSPITIGFSTFITVLMWLISLVMFTVAMDVVVGAAASSRTVVPEWVFKKKNRTEEEAVKIFRTKVAAYRKARIVTAPLLAMPVALIFALPALRNTQPGVPPVGAYCDVVGFFWNIGLTAVSAVCIASVWLVRKD